MSEKKLKHIDKYKFWQDGNHPLECDRAEMLQQKLDYIHQNPIGAELWQKHSIIYSAQQLIMRVERDW